MQEASADSDVAADPVADSDAPPADVDLESLRKAVRDLPERDPTMESPNATDTVIDS